MPRRPKWSRVRFIASPTRCNRRPQHAARVLASSPRGSHSSHTLYYVSVNTPAMAEDLIDPILLSTGPTIYPNGLLNAAGPVSETNDSPANSFAVGLAPGTLTAL